MVWLGGEDLSTGVGHVLVLVWGLLLAMEAAKGVVIV
jgi:hypothetical protein